MTTARPAIACLGAGRMGRGIAVAFAYAGHAVTMIDVKARSADQFATLEAEVVDLKRKVLAVASKWIGRDVIIASTTSTILVDDLSGAVEHRERFLNVHWLNPAYLIPLVEISPGAATDPAVIAP